MITDDLLALITAAVDGELSPTETQRFRRLLDSSSEARGLYVRLKTDSTRLRNLPPTPPPPNLLQRVMTKIAALTPPPSTRPEPALQPSLPRHSAVQPQSVEPATLPFVGGNEKSRRWVPVAVAASLLLAISGSSFWFFSRTGGKAGTVAHRTPDRPPPATHSGAGDPDWVRWLPSESGQHPIAPTPNAVPLGSQIVRNDSGTAATIPIEPIAVAIAPEPRPIRNSNIMGAEVRSEIPPLDLIRVRVPFLKQLSDFDREDTRQQFVEELARDPAFRIDIFTRHMPRSVEMAPRCGQDSRSDNLRRSHHSRTSEQGANQFGGRLYRVADLGRVKRSFCQTLR